MKNLAKILLFICTFYPAAIQAQTYKIAPSGDTINFLDKNNVKQGVWITNNEGIRGEPAFQFRCYYINGAKDGAGYKYTTDGDLLEEAYYKYDNLDSVYKYYDRSRLVLSGYYKAVNPTNPYETVLVQDAITQQETTKQVKLEGSTVKHGIWKYYENGKSVAKETYVLGVLQTPEANEADAVPRPKPAKPSSSAMQQFNKKNGTTADGLTKAPKPAKPDAKPDAKSTAK